MVVKSVLIPRHLMKAGVIDLHSSLAKI
jgi:hypothetical protein